MAFFFHLVLMMYSCCSVLLGGFGNVLLEPLCAPLKDSNRALWREVGRLAVAFVFAAFVAADRRRRRGGLGGI